MATPVPTGTRIRERRLALDLRQAHLAEAVGISPSYLNLIEHNRRPIGGGLLGKLAEALSVDQAALSSALDDTLIDSLRAAGAAQDLPSRALGDAAELARRYPEWARVIAAQAEALAVQAGTIETLSDRLTHDPALAEAMHELLSTVSVVRSTASILAQTPEIDANWLGRFHANLDADSRRLADGAEAVVSYLDRQAARGDARLTPSEIVAGFLEAAGHSFAVLETEGVGAVSDLVAPIANPQAQALAAELLEQDARDAARLPAAEVLAAAGPDALLARAGDPALVLRRLGLLDPARGLVICDAAGALIRRKPVAGFALPVMGAGCPLWPLYEALSQPGRPLVRRIEMPDGAQWVAHAVAQGQVGGFDEVPVLRATMLLSRADGQGGALGVGPGCRVCARDRCPARREPSVLGGLLPV
ncbi:short-chain fatty acyl-CoA regulator family protein [Jannaschia sp. M317]|uniref:short-chain fatty acyl-CoA regulator family protein n=1 Tax=Jannaschia sp. M317 TaxID=2867011 RepID=UPI0021A52822|nr:short-chain fatty acyl-CoA regulator family protein [Jannaschia sp. M317]UWQ19213.1 short-chain fatty acyl-CoA regulator family protein [Jannaschia sp. M317]